MANNYIQFSCELTHLTANEKKWLCTELVNRKFDDNGDVVENEEDAEPLSFLWSFIEKDRSLWMHADESGNLDQLAALVQDFLRTFRPTSYFAAEWAKTCSSPRVGEFGGGAVFVTAEKIEWLCTADWVGEQRAAFKARHPKPTRNTRGLQCGNVKTKQ